MHDVMRIPGLIRPPSDIKQQRNPKELILEQQPYSRGKEVCKRLREMRIALAAANGIEFYTQECKDSRPCAGTCSVCDDEIRYINKELNKIPPEQRVYPEQFMSFGNGGFR